LGWVHPKSAIRSSLYAERLPKAIGKDRWREKIWTKSLKTCSAGTAALALCPEQTRAVNVAKRSSKHTTCWNSGTAIYLTAGPVECQWPEKQLSTATNAASLLSAVSISSRLPVPAHFAHPLRRRKNRRVMDHPTGLMGDGPSRLAHFLVTDAAPASVREWVTAPIAARNMRAPKQTPSMSAS